MIDFALGNGQARTNDGKVIAGLTRTRKSVPQVDRRDYRGEAIDRAGAKDELKAAVQPLDSAQATVQQTYRASQEPIAEAAPAKGASRVIASDPTGHVVVTGEAGQTSGRANPGIAASPVDGQAYASGSGGSGIMRVLDYGKENLYARHYPFIDETINRRFKDKYPDRARRMGWEGKVVVSFVIFENGTIHDIRITKSSGRRDFDDHAGGILQGTTFSEKLSSRLHVMNWSITYTLQ